MSAPFLARCERPKSSVAHGDHSGMLGDMVRGMVKFFKAEKGWGAITSDDLPAGADAFVHFSEIIGQGYRQLTAGDLVECDFVPARQDSFGFVATRVRRLGPGPAPTLRRDGERVVIAPDGAPDTPLTPRRAGRGR